VQQKMNLGKQESDLCSSSLSQLFVAQYFTEGGWQEYVLSLRDVYRRRRDTMLDALAEHLTEVQPGLAALAAGKLDRFAGLIQSASIERGLLERSSDVIVLPGEFGWDDVGTWAALRRVRELDDEGNALSGLVHALESRDNVVHAAGNAVVLYGVRDLVVVTRDGLTLVTTVDKASDLKTLIQSLPTALRDQA